MRRFTLPFACCLLLALPAWTPAQDLKTLLKKLDSPDAEIRFDALMQLADLGPKAAPATDRLAALLTKFDDDERILAILALGKIGKPALPALEKLLTHEDELTRHDAVWSIGLIGKDARAFLPRLLKAADSDADDDVRCKAIYAVAHIAPQDEATLATLVKLLRDEKARPSVQLAILEQLQHWGEPAIPVLGAALRNEFTYLEAQKSLAHLLEQHKSVKAWDAMQPFAIDAYVQAVRSPITTDFRQLMAWQLLPTTSALCDGEAMSFVVKRGGAKLLPELEAKLRSKDVEERTLAVRVIGLMGRTLAAHADAGPRTIVPPDEGPAVLERIVKNLRTMLRHEDALTREAAAQSLPVTKATTALLQAALIDDDLAVRNAALATLSSHDLHWQNTLAARLQKSAGREKLRIAAAMAHDPAAANVLVAALSDKDAAVRQEAAYLIGNNHGFPGLDSPQLKKLLMPALVDGLKSNNPVARQWSAVAMLMNAFSLDDTCVPALLGALKDKNPTVRHHALGALRSRCDPGRKEILAAVEPFLGDPDLNTRLFAIHCCSHMGKLGLPPLLKILANEKEAWVRHRIIESIQQQPDPRIAAAFFKAAENAADWKDASVALVRMDGKAHAPKLLAILSKKDDKVRRTLADLLRAPATIEGAALALAPMLQGDDLSANLRAAHTLEQLAPLLLRPDKTGWLKATQTALKQQLPELRRKLQAKEVAVRRDAMAVVIQLWTLDKSLHGPLQHNLTAEITTLHDDNQASVRDLIGLARRDADLAIRRQARQALLPAFAF